MSERDLQSSHILHVRYPNQLTSGDQSTSAPTRVVRGVSGTRKGEKAILCRPTEASGGAAQLHERYGDQQMRCPASPLRKG